jgi:hypothetical protein
VTKIGSLAELLPGDVYFGPISGAVGVGVGLGQMLLGEGWSVGPLKIRHVGIVVEASGPGEIPESAYTYVGGPARDVDREYRAPRMVQAMPHGAEEIELTADRHWTTKCAYVRLAEDWPGQLADAAAVARLMVSEGVAYSFGSYAALALWHWGWETKRLESWIDRRGEVVRMDSWSNGPELGSGFTRGGRLPREAICSVLVDQCLTLAGKKVMIGTPKQCVTPGKLAGRLLFETPGAQWALPGRASTVI